VCCEVSLLMLLLLLKDVVITPAVSTENAVTTGAITQVLCARGLQREQRLGVDKKWLT
jgi:hypothetical protein